MTDEEKAVVMQALGERLIETAIEATGRMMPNAPERERLNVAMATLTTIAVTFGAAAELNRHATLALVTIWAEASAQDVFQENMNG